MGPHCVFGLKVNKGTKEGHNILSDHLTVPQAET